MTSNRRTELNVHDYVNEADDSDAEYLPVRNFEDLRNEIDVDRLYRALMRDNFVQFSANSASRKRISRAVQTDHDTSGIPQSWLVTGNKYVEELYQGLGNMINTLYFTPNGYCSEEIKLNPKCLKYFTYENGYLKCKSNPDIIIPAPGKNTQVHSEELKKDLYSLLEKATVLRNVIPYICELEDSNPLVTASKECQYPSPFKVETLKLDKAVGPSGDCFFNTSRYQNTISGNDLALEVSKSKQMAILKQSVPNKASTNRLQTAARNENGLVIVEGKIANLRKSPTTLNVPSAVAGCSNKEPAYNCAVHGNAKNRGNSREDVRFNTCIGSSIPSDGKNFIRRNILAAKFPRNHGTTSRFLHDRK